MKEKILAKIKARDTWCKTGYDYGYIEALEWVLEEEYPINEGDIKGITLLTTEEADQLPLYIAACGGSWWLRSPGWFSNYAANVDYNGDVDSAGTSLDFDEIAIRPVLLCDPVELPLGHVVKLFGEEWLYIGDGKLLARKPIGRCAFNKSSEKGNVYEGSDIEKYVNDWLEGRRK